MFVYVNAYVCNCILQSDIVLLCIYTWQSRRQSCRLRGGQVFIKGGQNLKLRTKSAVLKKRPVNLGAKHVDWGGQPPWPPLSAGPDTWPSTRKL